MLCKINLLAKYEANTECFYLVVKLNNKGEIVSIRQTINRTENEAIRETEELARNNKEERFGIAIVRDLHVFKTVQIQKIGWKDV